MGAVGEHVNVHLGGQFATRPDETGSKSFQDVYIRVDSVPLSAMAV